MTGKTDTKRIKPPSKPPASEVEDNKWLDLFSLFVHDLESPLASMKYMLKLLEERRLDLDNPLHVKILESSQIAMIRAESIIYDICP